VSDIEGLKYVAVKYNVKWRTDVRAV